MIRRHAFEHHVRRIWLRRGVCSSIFLPFALVFRVLTVLRRYAYRYGILRTYAAKKPVIVVGGITVGGSGKTPCVIAVTKILRECGMRVAIVVRGCGARMQHTAPYIVRSQDDATVVGDEARLLFLRTGVPVIVCVRKVRAVQQAEHMPVDVIVCDDGLQHYALARTVEIACLARKLPFGNGRVLPAGPLREQPHRIRSVDFVFSVAYGETEAVSVFSDAADVTDVAIDPTHWVAHATGERRAPDAFAGRTCAVCTAVALPMRFIGLVKKLGVCITDTILCADHADSVDIKAAVTALPSNTMIAMTEKDAMKLTDALPKEVAQRVWILCVDATICDTTFSRRLIEAIDGEMRK